jgi:hypothetical protein
MNVIPHPCPGSGSSWRRHLRGHRVVFGLSTRHGAHRGSTRVRPAFRVDAATGYIPPRAKTGRPCPQVSRRHRSQPCATA